MHTTQTHDNATSHVSLFYKDTNGIKIEIKIAVVRLLESKFFPITPILTVHHY